MRVESLGVYQPFIMFDNQLIQPEIESENLEKVYFEKAIKMSQFSFDDGKCPNIKKVMYPNLEVKPYSMNKNYFKVYYPRNIYESCEFDVVLFHQTLRANVSYYYNYEGADNSGYYFIDDCDYGGKIEFIPKEPVRENYTFGGWYKEAECINEWDFAADTLPQEITEPKENIYGEIEETVVYQETILYAKWILNS